MKNFLTEEPTNLKTYYLDVVSDSKVTKIIFQKRVDEHFVV